MGPHDTADSSAHRELASWKEIAAFLGVSIRTAQMWEQKRGLPVRRLPGGRGRVAASVAALEYWGASGESEEVEPRRPAGHRRAVWVATIALVVVLGAGALVILGRPHPAAARLEQQAFIVLDDRGRELWRKPFDWLDVRVPLTNNIWIGDLDGNGRTEVLFVPPLAERGWMYLVCYAEDGRELWRFRPGRTVATSREQFDPPYTVERFLVADFGHQRGLQIVVSGRHHTYYPDEIALLDTRGRVLREYWHPGYLYHMLAVDLAHTGTKQLVLGGVNNARRQATLVVLDPERFGGAAVEDNPAYQFQGFAPGIEEARLLFPPSCMDKALKAYNSVLWLRASSEGIIVAVLERPDPNQPTLYYHLNTELQLLRLGFSDQFIEQHAKSYGLGELDHPFSAEEEQALRAIQYMGHYGQSPAALARR